MFCRFRSSTPVQQIETEDELAARANFQWFLSSLSVPLSREAHPFKAMPIRKQSPEESFGMGLSLVAMLCRLKVESDRRQLYSLIFEGPISNRGKVRLN